MCYLSMFLLAIGHYGAAAYDISMTFGRGSSSLCVPIFQADLASGRPLDGLRPSSDQDMDVLAFRSFRPGLTRTVDRHVQTPYRKVTLSVPKRCCAMGPVSSRRVPTLRKTHDCTHPIRT